MLLLEEVRLQDRLESLVVDEAAGQDDLEKDDFEQSAEPSNSSS